jgi:hypothetical protein
MQVRGVSLPGIESNNHALAVGIDVDFLHPGDFEQRSPQFADAFIAVFAFGGYLDRFEDRVICVFRIMRIGGVHLSYSTRVDRVAAVCGNSGRRTRQTFSARIR